ncbi:hypothetical protein [Nonomuraea sp. NPDC049480]|uniref:hypothetical protein n=1 Tax=Nonomuraea sp. NPDC049480 TaxID=3364353 RepID=UPI0037A2CCC2
MGDPHPVHMWAALRPTLVQAAIDGAWETPIVLTGEEDLSDWLGEPDDLAVEVFFTTKIFLGVRLTGITAPVRTRFIRDLQTALARTGAELGDAAAFWKLPDGTSLLPGTPPQTLEVGVVNAWRSAGAVTVWRQGEPAPAPSRLSQVLRAPHPTPVAVEATYPGPVPTWIGWNVSQPVGPDRFRLDLAELDRATVAFLA